jgi:hypothetical protein
MGLIFRKHKWQILSLAVKNISKKKESIKWRRLHSWLFPKNINNRHSKQNKNNPNLSVRLIPKQIINFFDFKWYFKIFFYLIIKAIWKVTRCLIFSIWIQTLIKVISKGAFFGFKVWRWKVIPLTVKAC